MTGDLFPEVVQGTEGDTNQRFTTAIALAWCLKTANVDRLDLDVAACEEAHCAPDWYGWKRGPTALVLIDGLVEPWAGNTWLQPPWDDLKPWVARAHSEIRRHGGPLVILALLPQGRCHRPWWQLHVEPYRDRGVCAGASLTTHYPPERFAYGHRGNREAVGVGEPNFGSVLLVWRRAQLRR